MALYLSSVYIRSVKLVFGRWVRLCAFSPKGACASETGGRASVPRRPRKSMKPIEARRVNVDNKRWHYRGEGNANLVITIPEDQLILRFAKTKYPDKDQDAKITEIAYFANEVMRPALGPHFVRSLGIGLLGKNDFMHIKQEAQKFRPPKRCKKDIQCKKVIWSPDCVFLTKEYAANTKGKLSKYPDNLSDVSQDYVTGETFSIEIKPKQGWHSLKATCSVDLCHRCLKQHAKLYQGEIDSISR